jgi:integrase
MPTYALTKTVVDKLDSTGREYVVWDTTTPGFGVRVSARGAKSYILMYRAGRGRGGRLRKVTIAKVGDLTVSEARKFAFQLRGDVARGEDPAGESTRKRRELTLREAAQRYLAEHVSVHNKPSWANQIELLLRVHILPRFGTSRIGDITRAEIIKWHSEKPAGNYGTNRCLAILRKLLTIAHRDWRAIETNPAAGIRLHREIVRCRFYNDAEIAQIGAWLANNSELPHFVLATRLLLLTGMRLGEVLALRWSDVDLSQGILRLRDSKVGARAVALNPEVVTYLAEFPMRGEYVVGPADGKIALTKGSYHSFWRRLLRATGLQDARPHDFRHTVATLGAIGGANAFILRDLLGHKTVAITSGYVARTLDPVRAVSNAIGVHVAAALNPSSAQSGKIVSFDRRSKKTVSHE